MSPLDGMAVAHSPGWSGWWIVAGITGVIVWAILAEAEIPKAAAGAFRTGNLGVIYRQQASNVRGNG